ncbi:unnamed protein product, partial [Schistosoma turkestanicum]
GIQEFCNSYQHLCVGSPDKSQPTSNESKISPIENLVHNDSKNKFAHSLNISLTKTKCRKLEFKCSPILLPGLGLSVENIEHKPIRLDKSVKQSNNLDSTTVIHCSSSTNPTSKQWNLEELCLNDNDPGDPKDIFRAEISRIFPFLYL